MIPVIPQQRTARLMVNSFGAVAFCGVTETLAAVALNVAPLRRKEGLHPFSVRSRLNHA
ncbi:MAG TPA: hypothetical protein VFG20_07795 [Planctomycetaceae bacterium]|jgi:hypothetical protein|nr:hypothetical protein [Planctomycetaceae bacterium]